LGLTEEQPPFCQPIIQGKELFKEKLEEWVSSERLS
jgi:3-methyl-2-oxobutanoate hydroxymethyltransferase